MYTVDSDQVVTITGQAITDDTNGNPLDVVLAVRDDAGNRIAYDDDGAATLDGFAETDPALQDLRLTTGTYVVHVNVFNGVQSGEIALTIETE